MMKHQPYEYETREYWNWEKFDIAIIKVPGDGNCFFHAIANAFYIPYQEGQADRQAIVENLRRDIADALQNTSLYDTLSRGELAAISQEVPEVSRDRLQSLLRSSSYVGHEVLELVSHLLHKDIYILDLEKSDVYRSGDASLLYQKRSSIVLAYRQSHFDLVGYINGSDITTHFLPEHPFIKSLYARLHEKEGK